MNTLNYEMSTGIKFANKGVSASFSQDIIVDTQDSMTEDIGV